MDITPGLLRSQNFFEDGPNRGSEFTVRLPLAAPEGPPGRGRAIDHFDPHPANPRRRRPRRRGGQP